MAIVTGAMSFRQAAVDFGAATASLTSMDSAGTAVRVSGGARGSAFANTFDGDFPVLDSGKLEPLDIEVRFLYTEASDEPFEIARAIYETEGGACFLRYSPDTDASSSKSRFSAASAAGVESAGVMTDFLYPSGEASGNEIIPGGFTLRVERILKGSVVV